MSEITDLSFSLMKSVGCGTLVAYENIYRLQQVGDSYVIKVNGTEWICATAAEGGGVVYSPSEREWREVTIRMGEHIASCLGVGWSGVPNELWLYMGMWGVLLLPGWEHAYRQVPSYRVRFFGKTVTVGGIALYDGGIAVLSWYGEVFGYTPSWYVNLRLVHDIIESVDEGAKNQYINQVYGMAMGAMRGYHAVPAGQTR